VEDFDCVAGDFDCIADGFDCVVGDSDWAPAAGQAQIPTKRNKTKISLRIYDSSSNSRARAIHSLSGLLTSLHLCRVCANTFRVAMPESRLRHGDWIILIRINALLVLYQGTASQAAEKSPLECFVTGHDFRVCVRTKFHLCRWSMTRENQAP
jgi:hypothetical protein